MPISLTQFTRQLVESGLMSPADVEAVVANVRAESPPLDGEQLARLLIKQKKLTKFQAEQIYAGKGKSLTLGSYVILDKLGQGGMGMVLKAEHRRMKRIVALKVMSPDAMKSAGAVKRFHREAQAAARLDHQHIVAAFDADQANGTHFLVMQFVEGRDLSEIVKQNGPLPVEQAVSCILQAALGLEFAHEQGVIHRDIKPANLLLDVNGTLKILDMGLARLDDSVGGSSEGAGLTSTGTIMGTVDYMSPEQAMDTKHADARSDIYSLGITLYYLLTGRVAYSGDTIMKKLMAHQNAPIPSLCSQLAPRDEGRASPGATSSTSTAQLAGDSACVSRSDTATLKELDAVFRRMVAKRPEDRPQTMTQVIKELQRCLEGGSPTMAVNPQVANASIDDTMGTNIELQRFLKNLSDGANSATTSAETSRSRERDLHLQTADGEIDTVPRAEQSPTLRMGNRLRRDRSPGTGTALQVLLSPKGLVVSASAVVLALIGIAFALRSSSGIRVPLAANQPSKAGGNTKREAAPASGYALHFDGNSFVQIPTLNWNDREAVTLEFVVMVNANEAAVAGTSIVASWSSLKAADELLVYRDGGLWAFDQRYSTGRWISAVDRVRSDERVLLTCIWDGKRTSVKANGDHGNDSENPSGPILGKPGLWIGGLEDHANLRFRGTIEQVRISKGVRTALPGVPAGKLPKEKSTLALYYFDEGRGRELKDSSGNNHHGKIVGANWVTAGNRALPTPPPPIDRHALNFDGVDDYVDLPAFQPTESFTVEAICTPRRYAHAQIVSSRGFYLSMHNDQPSWSLVGRVANNQFVNITCPQEIASGQRVTLAGLYDGKKLRLFVDGKLIGEMSSDRPASIFRIGSVTGPPNNFFPGTIEAVRISRGARYDSNYSLNEPWQPDESTLALYRFDEGSGDVLKDSSGNNHHGQITGAKWVRVDGSPIGAAAGEMFTNSLGMDFVRVPKGKSWLGGGGGKPGTQAVEFREDFYLGKFEVTQDEWLMVMGKEAGHFTRGGAGKEVVKAISDADLKRFPVDSASWNDAQQFLAKLNERSQESGWQYRLPTEAEWEYACRGGPLTDPAESAADRFFTLPANSHLREWINMNNHRKRPHWVGSYPPNRLGLYDMLGNVQEWCADVIVTADPLKTRATRGSGWENATCNISHRFEFDPTVRQYVIGLRVARVPIAGQWQPLLNGKDLSLSDWRQQNQKDTGRAELLVEDGQPVLRLTPFVGRTTRDLRNYHLRFDYKVERGSGGGIHQVGGVGDIRFRLNRLAPANPVINLDTATVTFEEAELRDGRIVGKGRRFKDGESLPFQNLTLNAGTPWQRIEILRLDDACLYVFNGRVAAAITGIRGSRDGTERPIDKQSVKFWTDNFPTSFRNIELREINALPMEVLNQNAAAWQPLFNGKDLTGLKQRAANGIAEIVVEDGQPILRLQDKSNLTTRRFGDYHLRLEFRPEKGSKVRPFSDSVSAQLIVDLGDNLTKANLNGTEMTYETATISSGRFVGSGQTIDSKLHPYPDPLGRLTFTNATPNPNTPWQRLEILRLGDSCAVLLNGQLVAAATNIRITRPGEPAKFPALTELGLTAYGGPASYRNIEIREITSFPPELLK